MCKNMRKPKLFMYREFLNKDLQYENFVKINATTKEHNITISDCRVIAWYQEKNKETEPLNLILEKLKEVQNALNNNVNYSFRGFISEKKEKDDFISFKVEKGGKFNLQFALYNKCIYLHNIDEDFGKIQILINGFEGLVNFIAHNKQGSRQGSRQAHTN